MSDSTFQPEGLPVSRGRWRTSFLIGLLCFVLYNANLRAISAGDTYPARYLPFAIVKDHTILLDPVAKVAAQGRGKGAYWMFTRPDGHAIAIYPIVTPVLVAPLYIPAVQYLEWSGWTDARFDHVARVMEKLAASLVASLSASLLYLLLLRRTKHATALLLTLAYACGTTTWTISSQALWQHGPAALLVIATLLFLTGRCTVPRILAAGLCIGLIAGNRPPDVVLSAALGVYGLFWSAHWRRALLLFAASCVPMAGVFAYNLIAAGNILGGYGLIGRAVFFSHQLLPGIAGMLVSPTRGLLVFSPFFLFLALAWRHRFARRADRLLTLAMIAAIALQIVIYAKADWRGGLSWGPRYMTDALPFLIWMLVPVVDALRNRGRAVFMTLVALSVAIQAIGAFQYTGWVDNAIFVRDRGYLVHDMRGAFAWRNTPIRNSFAHGLMPPDLLRPMRGNVDAIEAGGRPVKSIVAGEEAYATGWALAGDATPFQVAINIDGRHAGAANEFVDRVDVRETLKAGSRSGWRVPLDTSALPPGEHRLTVLAWAYAKGEPRYLTDRMLTIVAPQQGSAVAASEIVPADLTESTRIAASRIREHQDAQGYWLTSFTSGSQFREPRPEMNTFVTALLVDLLDPVATTAGLEATLQRARTHLTAQIEAGGLVRYHGRPDAPGIGTLGCAITPDTDNTALTWRLAPAADRNRLTAALTTIDRYRTRDGLYRTWLAPRDQYQCLDPGSDPNPADIAIQMHLLMLLSTERPAEAKALCQALRPRVDDDRVWVYYRNAPLVPMLRIPDLRDAGCALQLPASRLRSGVDDQQIWISVVRLLQDDVPRDPVLMRAVLRELAKDDFALVRTHPPLLFHNDLTATVPRYYWSEDAGYALWLRLFAAYRSP